MSADDVERACEDTERRLGLPVRVLNSSDYAFLSPGFWVLYHAGGFSTGHEAAAVCSSHGAADTDCLGRLTPWYT